MSRKKPGYDFVTNTYYIDDGGCFGMLIGLVIAGVAIGAVVTWLKEHVWLMIAAILVIIGIASLFVYRRSVERKKQKAIDEYNEKQRRSAEKTPEEREKEIGDFINLWRSQNYLQVEKLKEQYDFIPVADHEELRQHFFISEFVPQGIEKLLVYLEPPFAPPVIGDNDSFLRRLGSDTIFNIFSERSLLKPILVDVTPGKMFTAVRLGKEEVKEDIGDMRFVWCRKKG